MPAQPEPETLTTSPLYLIAVLVSARRSKDRALERVTRRRLDALGVDIRFGDELDRRASPLEVPHVTRERGYTPRELARLWHMSPDYIRTMIQRGELGAINTARVRCGRPRYVILPEHRLAWQQANSVARPAPAPRRRRQAVGAVDYFPD